MQCSEKGRAFIAQREAIVLSAHRDTALLAIGIGHNDKTLTDGETRSLAETLEVFAEDIAEYDRNINTIFKGFVLKQHQHDALVSLCFNLGATQLRKQADLVNAVMAYCLDQANRSLRDWAAYHLVRARFDEKTGAFNLSRRCREALMFISADYGDLSTVKIWQAGKNPRVDQPEIIPMPTFLSN